MFKKPTLTKGSKSKPKPRKKAAPIRVLYLRSSGGYNTGEMRSFQSENEILKSLLIPFPYYSDKGKYIEDRPTVKILSDEEFRQILDEREQAKQLQLEAEAKIKADSFAVVFLRNHGKFHMGDISSLSQKEIMRLMRDKRDVEIDSMIAPKVPVLRPATEDDFAKSTRELATEIHEAHLQTAHRSKKK